MSTQPENLNPVQLSKVNETDPARTAGTAEGKKAFVEPEVTRPVDVLEATSFFQRGDSGVPEPEP